MARKKEIRFKIAGTRLKAARKAMSETLTSISDHDGWEETVNVYDPKILGNWEREGVPENRLHSLAEFLHLPSYVLTKSDISDEVFGEIVNKRKEDPEADINDLLQTKNGKEDLDGLETTITNYHQKVLGAPRNKELQDVFVSPVAVEDRKVTLSMIFDLDRTRPVDEGLRENKEADQQGRKEVIPDLMKQERQFVLLGDPGTGKTSCLLLYYFDLIGKYKEGGETAIYVPLVKYRSGMKLIALVSQASEIPKESLKHLLKEGRVVLLLDALDEVKSENRDSCVGAIVSFLTDFPNVGMVLTSRIKDWRYDLTLPTFTLTPLSNEKQLRFLGSYLKDNERAEDILELLHAHPDGETIAKNPWMLAMISKIIQEGEDLPQERVSIYRLYVERWYEREFKKAHLSNTDLPWTNIQVFDNLCYIAAHMRINGYSSEAPLSWIIETLAEKLTAGRKMIDFLGQGMICSANREDDSFSFLNKPLQEYLAAEYVLKKPDLLDSVEQSEFSDWDMILKYAFEIEENPSQAFIHSALRINSQMIPSKLQEPGTC